MEYLDINEVEILFSMLENIEQHVSSDTLKEFPQIEEAKFKCDTILVSGINGGNYHGI